MVRKKIVYSSQKLRITIKNIEEKYCEIMVRTAHKEYTYLH